MLFRNKLQTLLILLVGITSGLLCWLSLSKANHLAFELIQEKVLSIAVSTAPLIDGDAVSLLQTPDQDGTPEYSKVRDQIRGIRDANSDGALPIRFIYIIRPTGDDTWEYVVDAEEDGEDKSYLGDEVEFLRPEAIPPLQQARVDETYTKDSFGTWLSAFAPIRNAEGEPVALVGADIGADRIKALLKKLMLGELFAMLIALALASAVAAWLSRKVTLPLTQLRDFVRKLANGDYSARLKIQSRDEFGELAVAANQMADALEERESLKGALVNYVRSQAADKRLSKTSSIPAEPTTRRVTVLVADLRGFGQLSSTLGTERVFALLNEYFSTMIDVILRHRGSLEKSSHESVIAVFGSTGHEPHQERQAVQAALEMQQALDALIHTWEIETEIPVCLQIGIHSDDALATRTGAQENLDYDSVHSVLEVATSVKNAAEQSKSGLVVSDKTAENLHHTFPFTPVEDDSLDLGLFAVKMPKLARR